MPVDYKYILFNIKNDKLRPPDMSQNKLWKEKKLILPWIKWIKKKSKHSDKYIFEIGLHLFD
jgi:hypothetical protein